MANKIYQLQYDDEIDRDIHEWLNSLPRSRKAEMVRNAIRFYLHATNGAPTPIIPVVPVAAPAEQQAEQPKRNRKPPALPKDEKEFNEKSAK
jgi:hypothetical protein